MLEKHTLFRPLKIAYSPWLGWHFYLIEYNMQFEFPGTSQSHILISSSHPFVPHYVKFRWLNKMNANLVKWKHPKIMWKQHNWLILIENTLSVYYTSINKKDIIRLSLFEVPHYRSKLLMRTWSSIYTKLFQEIFQQYLLQDHTQSLDKLKSLNAIYSFLSLKS